ncbi:hypothetical protein [Methanofollis ethanolicus]|uniref:hypothetical protein n=1 Tax=Methanofollis ethanolicus TaxID=488124 RepID=UPI00082CF4B6|nr:hypothetical protein [Methanofollis ethanolicus]
MKAQFVFCILLISAILVGGCEGLSKAKYHPGDVISFEDGYQDVAYVVLDYDETLDQYFITFIHRDGLGRWMRADIDTKTWEDRSCAEMIYKYKLGHVDIDDLKMITLRL